MGGVLGVFEIDGSATGNNGSTVGTGSTRGLGSEAI